METKKKKETEEANNTHRHTPKKQNVHNTISVFFFVCFFFVCFFFFRLLYGQQKNTKKQKKKKTKHTHTYTLTHIHHMDTTLWYGGLTTQAYDYSAVSSNISDVIDDTVRDLSFAVCSQSSEDVDCVVLAGIIAGMVGIGAAAVASAFALLRKNTKKKGQRKNRGSMV